MKRVHLLLMTTFPIALSGALSTEEVKVFTNKDLDASKGNVTTSEPAEDQSYQLEQPLEEKSDDAKELEQAEIRKLKKRYQALRARQERIEAELPAALDAASREFGVGVTVINGTIWNVYSSELVVESYARRHAEELTHELGDIQVELEQIESEARRYGLGRPGLMQK